GDSTYSIWIAPLEVKALEGTALLLSAPPATRGWVSKRFGRILESCASAVLGRQIQVALEGTGGPAPGSREELLAHGDNLNPRYSFDQFIIGEGNRLAHAASLAVA